MNDFFDRVLKAVTMLSAVVLAIIAFSKQNASFYLVGSGLIVAYLIFQQYSKRTAKKQKPKVILDHEAYSATSIIRGLIPFQAGDTLLGREREAKDVLTKLLAEECRLAYISGEPGTGKTSLLLASTIPQLRNLGRPSAYLSCLGTPNYILDSLSRTLSALQQATGTDKAYIFIDQFEVALANLENAERRVEFAASIKNLCETANRQLTLVFVLPSSFVDELQDFGHVFGNSLTHIYRTHLQRWTSDATSAVIKEAISLDKLQITEELREDLVRDLSSSGGSLPAEVQLVLASCRDNNAFTRQDYVAMGGVHGILSSVISSVIESSRDNQENMIQVLTVLASNQDQGDRTGLTSDEILEQLSRSKEAPHQVSLETVGNLLRDLQRSYIAISMPGNRFRLLHDYLIHLINSELKARSGEIEHSTRLLRQYINTFNQDPSFRIPFRKLLAVRRSITALKTELPPTAHALFRVSLRSHFNHVALLCLGFILALTAVSPPFVKIHHNEFRTGSDEGSWTVSPSAEFAFYSGAEESSIWDLRSDPPKVSVLPFPASQFSFSRDSSMATCLSDAGELYFGSPGDFFSKRQQMLLDVPEKRSPEGWMRIQSAFSGDGNFLAYTDSSGVLWAISLKKEGGRRVRVGTMGATGGLYLCFTHNSKYLIAINDVRELFVYRTRDFMLLESFAIGKDTPIDQSLVMSDDSAMFLFRHPQGVGIVYLNGNDSQDPVHVGRSFFVDADPHMVQYGFRPNSHVVLIRGSNGDWFTVDLDNAGKRTLVVDEPTSKVKSMNMSWPSFTRSGKYALVATDTNDVYLISFTGERPSSKLLWRTAGAYNYGPTVYSSEDESVLLLVTDSGLLRTYSLNGLRVNSEINIHTDHALIVGVSDDGWRMIVDPNTVRLIAPDESEETFSFGSDIQEARIDGSRERVFGFGHSLYVFRRHQTLWGVSAWSVKWPNLPELDPLF